MVNRMQFKQSIKKEWFEIVRTKKLAVYFLLSFGYMSIHLIFQILFNIQIVGNAVFGEFVKSNLYLSQKMYNSFLLEINLIIVLFMNRNVVIKELKEKKISVPMALGLKASINITSKMLVQILVPSFIAFIASLSNGALSALFLQNVVVTSKIYGVISVNFQTIAISSLSIFITMSLVLLSLISLQALFRNSSIALVIAIMMLIIGDDLVGILGISPLTPVAFQSFAQNLASNSTSAQKMFSIFTTLSSIVLIAITGALVYIDRNDFAL